MENITPDTHPPIPSDPLIPFLRPSNASEAAYTNNFFSTCCFSTPLSRASSPWNL